MPENSPAVNIATGPAWRCRCAVSRHRLTVLPNPIRATARLASRTGWDTGRSVFEVTSNVLD